MKINKKNIAIFIVLLAVGFLLGRGCVPGTQNPVMDGSTTTSTIDFWTCAMHPQINQPDPGLCPLCGMDLIPVKKGGSMDLGVRQVHLSPMAEKLAEVATVSVKRDFATARIRLVGKVAFDERRIADISARVPGRLDRLYVDYTGIKVNKGDHLVYLYSPELFAAQEELIQARRTAKEMEKSDNVLMKERMLSTARAASEKLRLLGLTKDQIATIETSGKPSEHLTIYAPVSGIVIEKHAIEGAYIQTGTKIYTIADMSQLWVKLDAYESDLAWLHYGQDVEFEAEAYPGEMFHGTIAFIDPVLNPKTRTVKVRVNVANTDLKLKPEMFVRAVVKSHVAAGGKVMNPDLAGKWICPMHPEIVKDAEGICDLCEMDLVSSESLGYASADPGEAPLVIPVTAPLLTGKRAVVYVAVVDQPGVYEGREVVLGPRAGDHYIVYKGLAEGEQVVVNGAFKIDSAIQIQAKPSMMNSGEGGKGLSHGGSHSKHEGSHSKHEGSHAKHEEPVVTPTHAEMPAMDHEGSGSKHEGSHSKNEEGSERDE